MASKVTKNRGKVANLATGAFGLRASAAFLCPAFEKGRRASRYEFLGSQLFQNEAMKPTPEAAKFETKSLLNL